MAGSVNKVILIGNLGADPEVKSFQNGGKIANLLVELCQRDDQFISHDTTLGGNGALRQERLLQAMGCKAACKRAQTARNAAQLGHNRGWRALQNRHLWLRAAQDQDHPKDSRDFS